MLRLLCTLALSLITASSGSAQEKKRVAVLDFNYATVKTSVQSIFGTHEDIGKGVTDLLINKLVNDGTYRVIERQSTKTLIDEQNFSNSNRADPASAAKIGRLLGVDAIIIGDITEFGRDDHQTNVGGMGKTLDKYGLGGLRLSKAKATVAVTAKLVDINTGEILASATREGISQRSGTNLLSGSGSGGGATDMGSTNFSQTIIGEAVQSAVNNLGASLDAQAAKLPVAPAAAKPPLSGLVADVSGNDLVLNVGSVQGVQVGEVLKITHPGRVVRDPATGKPLHTFEETLGTVTITSVEGGSSLGTFAGPKPPKVGDAVTTK